MGPCKRKRAGKLRDFGHLLSSAVFDDSETGIESWRIKNRAWTRVACRLRADSCGPRTRLPPNGRASPFLFERLLQATVFRMSVSAGSVVLPFSKA
jgi:hypothetical protein